MLWLSRMGNNKTATKRRTPSSIRLLLTGSETLLYDAERFCEYGRRFHVSDIQTTFELKTKKRPWISEAHEHEKRSEGPGSSASKGTRPFGCLAVIPLVECRDGWPLYISSPLSPTERRYRSGEKSRASVSDVSFHRAHLPVRTSVYAGRHCGRQAVRPGRQTESSQTRVQGISAATPSGID